MTCKVQDNKDIDNSYNFKLSDEERSEKVRTFSVEKRTNFLLECI